MMSTHNLEDFMEVDKNDPPVIAKYPTLICLLVGWTQVFGFIMLLLFLIRI